MVRARFYIPRSFTPPSDERKVEWSQQRLVVNGERESERNRDTERERQRDREREIERRKSTRHWELERSGTDRQSLFLSFFNSLVYILCFPSIRRSVRAIAEDSGLCTATAATEARMVLPPSAAREPSSLSGIAYIYTHTHILSLSRSSLLHCCALSSVLHSITTTESVATLGHCWVLPFLGLLLLSTRHPIHRRRPTSTSMFPLAP